MPLNGTGNDWGDKVIVLIQSLSDYDTEFDASEKTLVRDFWRGACTVHEDHIIDNALVQTTNGAPNSEHTGEIQ